MKKQSVRWFELGVGVLLGLVIGLVVAGMLKLTSFHTINQWLVQNPSLVKTIGATFVGLLALYQFSRNILVKNTVAERREWRKKMRKIAEKQTLNEADYSVILANINPDDDKDTTLKKAITGGNSTAVKNALYKLLKHDWERSKAETSVFFWLPLQAIVEYKYKDKE